MVFQLWLEPHAPVKHVIENVHRNLNYSLRINVTLNREKETQETRLTEAYQ